MSEHKKSILRKLEPVIFLLVFFAFFGGLGYFMGAKNMISTLMNTAHDLLINTCFYLMAVCVLSGAISELLINFGVISLLEKILRPLMQPIFNLPGAAALGGVMTFFSDNPSIIPRNGNVRPEMPLTVRQYCRSRHTCHMLPTICPDGTIHSPCTGLCLPVYFLPFPVHR